MPRRHRETQYRIQWPPHLALTLAVDAETHDAEDLDRHRRCPRSYLYQRILQLSGARSDNSYVSISHAQTPGSRGVGHLRNEICSFYL